MIIQMLWQYISHNNWKSKHKEISNKKLEDTKLWTLVPLLSNQ